MKKIITLGDIFKNIETEDKAYNFLKYIKDLQEKDKEIERLNNRIHDLLKDDTEYKLENERLNNIINELHSDLKTLWIVLWNMDTEMTGYQNEVFDKYYDEFHKEELKESGNNE